jgi:hypothetical protein
MTLPEDHALNPKNIKMSLAKKINGIRSYFPRDSEVSSECKNAQIASSCAIAQGWAAQLGSDGPQFFLLLHTPNSIAPIAHYHLEDSSDA